MPTMRYAEVHDEVFRDRQRGIGEELLTLIRFLEE